MPDLIKIWIPGKVEPGGSKKGFINPRTGRMVITDDCKNNASWKQAVATHARFAYRTRPLTGALKTECLIVLSRPNKHFVNNDPQKALKANAPIYPTVKPDATKLWRSTEDGLTGVLWVDDALIVDQRVVEGYCGGVNLLHPELPCPLKPGAYITVWKLETNNTNDQ